MTPWRAVARYRYAFDLLAKGTKLFGQTRYASHWEAVISKSGCNVSAKQIEASLPQFGRGFAATSGESAGPTNPAPPVDAVPDYLSSSDLEAEGSDIEASDIEASDLDDEESRLASDGAGLGTGGPATTGQLQVPTIDGVSQQEEDALLNKIQSSSKKHQRHILQQLLTGNELTGTAPTGDEADAAELAQKSQKYSLKLVDVNSTNKGTKSGGVQSFSAMVVVGNHEGLLGHGTGKAAELVPAIRKASLRAMNSLTYVPRWERFTILHPVDTKYGKCKLRMYPLASGGGIRANNLLGTVASLAGINAIGIKTHGSRNARNSVKALFQAFDQLTTIEKRAQEMGKAAVEVVCGSRYHPNPRKYRYATRLSK